MDAERFKGFSWEDREYDVSGGSLARHAIVQRTINAPQGISATVVVVWCSERLALGANRNSMSGAGFSIDPLWANP
jgi:hypothetical protein